MTQDDVKKGATYTIDGGYTMQVRGFRPRGRPYGFICIGGSLTDTDGCDEFCADMDYIPATSKQVDEINNLIRALKKQPKYITSDNYLTLN